MKTWEVPESEVCILGGILMSPSTLKAARGALEVEDFTTRRHQLIYQAMISISDNGDPIQPTSIHNVLTQKGINGQEVSDYLMEIVKSVHTSVGMDYHIRQVKGNSMRRELLAISSDIQDGLKIEDPQEFLDKIKDKISDIKPQANGTRVISLKDALPGVMESLEKAEDPGAPTGFTDLDELLGGWQAGDLVVLAGRPGMGKSVLSKDFAEAAKVPVLVFSLEMPYDQLIKRQLASKSNINFTAIRRSKLREQDWPKAMKGANALNDMPIYYNDQADLNIDELIATCHEHKEQNGIGMIVIDYLQLIGSRVDEKSREREVASISRKLKVLARTLGIPVICLAQLNRKCEDRGGDKKPMLSDLRESGAIEQDADTVIFIWREAVYKKKADKYDAELIVAKGRNTGTGVVNVFFDGSRQVFSQNPFWREG
jgi:replicative DNA helicase